jgi:hypothetical protein
MIELKAQIEGIQSRKDNTIKITLGTQELKPTDGGKLLALNNKLCSIGIAPNDLTPKEIETLQESRLSIEDVPNGKSLSQRLRGALYVYWTQNDTGFSEFNDFYSEYMEKKINHVKSKLE